MVQSIGSASPSRLARSHSMELTDVMSNSIAAGLHLRLDARVGDRRDGADLDAGRSGERLEIGRLLRGGVAAAPRVDVERARLRDGALREQERAERRGCRAAAGMAQEAAAPTVETPFRSSFLVVSYECDLGLSTITCPEKSYRRTRMCASPGAQASRIVLPRRSASGSPPTSARAAAGRASCRSPGWNRRN